MSNIEAMKTSIEDLQKARAEKARRLKEAVEAVLTRRRTQTGQPYRPA